MKVSEMIRKTAKDTDPGFRNMAQRQHNAWLDLVEYLQKLGKISEADAKKVANYYIKEKFVKLDIVGGRYNPKHGAFFDKEVIQRAVHQAK